MATKDTIPLVNDTRFADLNKLVVKLGKDAADGVDALPKLALAVATAAFDRVIDLEPKHAVTRDKKSINVDDADILYDVYQKADGKKQFGDYKTTSRKAQVSKLRAIVKAGLNPNCELPKVLIHAAELRNQMAEQKTKVLPAYPAFVQVAREQAELDRPMTDDELREAIAKPQTDAASVVDYVTRAKNVLDKLITGENADGVKCQDENVLKAFEALNSFLQLEEKREAFRAMVAQAAELGMTVLPVAVETKSVDAQ